MGDEAEDEDDIPKHPLWTAAGWAAAWAIAVVSGFLGVVGNWDSVDAFSRAFWRGERSQWLGVLIGLSLLLFVVVWFGGIVLHRIGHAIGKREGAATARSSAKADAAKLETKHHAELTRERDARATDIGTWRKWYRANPDARVRVFVYNGTIEATWHSLSRMTASFGFGITSSCIWPQFMQPEIVKFQPNGGGECFVVKLSEGSRLLSAGSGWSKHVNPTATPEELASIANRPELQTLEHQELAAIPGQIVALVRFGFDGGELDEAVSVSAPVVLVVRNSLDPPRRRSILST